MTDLPPPLVPPDCDLRGYEYMPLFGNRLFGSEFYARATDAEFRAAMRLWWSAWQQCPAGSLPDDDRALALLADFGRDLRGFRRVRDVALHGFIKCNDGRLYHPVLCNEALTASEMRKKERMRKAAWRERGGGNGPEQTPYSNGLDEDVPRDKTGTSASGPRDVHPYRTGQDRTVNKKKEVDPPFSPPRQAAPSAEKMVLPDWMPPEWQEWETYRLAVGRKSWTQQVRHFSIASLDALRREGNDPAAVIRQAIAGGFTAFRALPAAKADATGFTNGFAQILHEQRLARGFIEPDEDDEPPAFNRFLGGPTRAH